MKITRWKGILPEIMLVYTAEEENLGCLIGRTQFRGDFVRTREKECLVL